MFNTLLSQMQTPAVIGLAIFAGFVLVLLWFLRRSGFFCAPQDITQRQTEQPGDVGAPGPAKPSFFCALCQHTGYLVTAAMFVFVFLTAFVQTHAPKTSALSALFVGAIGLLCTVVATAVQRSRDRHLSPKKNPAAPKC